MKKAKADELEVMITLDIFKYICDVINWFKEFYFNFQKRFSEKSLDLEYESRIHVNI